MSKSRKAYGIGRVGSGNRLVAPTLPYQPPRPRRYNPPIGLIGCGGITAAHLRAYRAAGYRVVALCDLHRERAEGRRKEFFPEAAVYTDHRDLLKRDDVEVVDIATHPEQRPPLIRAALVAGKHVLSQKPFVLDLDIGARLVDLAERQGVKLAVNQNGRWAPHFSYLRHAVAAGLIGEVNSIDLSVRWDHSWTAGTPFDTVHHLILYDFGIHWFDMVACLAQGAKAMRVFASMSRTSTQKARPALQAQALIEFDHGQASLVFAGHTLFGQRDTSFVVGTQGTLASAGPDLTHQQVTLATKRGIAQPKLKGTWFVEGFQGTMGELLNAIETRRTPSNNAADNLRSLALCFAAAASADRHQPMVPGKVRRMQ